MSKTDKVELSELTRQTNFLSIYGFEITDEYTQMLLEQIALRDREIDHKEQSIIHLNQEFADYRRETDKKLGRE